MNIRERHIKRCKGTRKWLFAWEMDQRFGAQIGEQMRVRKEENAELSQREIRYHPELDKTEDSKQFLTLVDDAEDESHEEELERLFQCIDDSDDSSSSNSESKRKSKKKKSQKQSTPPKASAS
ncbi:unnamed protein product [Cladocopium goreaui]|uniref:Uncharacterized protein n=1 Tax=Cladocopium goreaui TaxID=2562237 RepID=A0A9P1FIE9_9DINO|nr:unnamed protein product [Cladocopium goreaui]